MVSALVTAFVGGSTLVVLVVVTGWSVFLSDSVMTVAGIGAGSGAGAGSAAGALDLVLEDGAAEPLAAKTCGWPYIATTTVSGPELLKLSELA